MSIIRQIQKSMVLLHNNSVVLKKLRIFFIIQVLQEYSGLALKSINFNVLFYENIYDFTLFNENDFTLVVAKGSQTLSGKVNKMQAIFHWLFFSPHKGLHMEEKGRDSASPLPSNKSHFSPLCQEENQNSERRQKSETDPILLSKTGNSCRERVCCTEPIQNCQLQSWKFWKFGGRALGHQ